MRAWKPEFPNDYSAHHFHVGCAISENPQSSETFGFTRQKSDGHRMAAFGPEADWRLLEGKVVLTGVVRARDPLIPS